MTNPLPKRFGRRSAPGLTLLEVLVTLFIVGIVLTITLPMLWRTKQIAGDTKVLADLGTHAKVFATYCNDYKDHFPQLIDIPPPPYTITDLPGSDPRVKVPYFAASYLWSMYLASTYYNLQPDAGVFFPPRYPEGLPSIAKGLGRSPTPYNFSCSLLASPAFWFNETRTGPDQWGSVRSGDVQFPAKKAQLVNSYAWWSKLNRKTGAVPTSTEMEMAAVDGHAQAVSIGEYTTGYFNGDGEWSSGSVHPREWLPGLHTITGARGRDIP